MPSNDVEGRTTSDAGRSDVRKRRSLDRRRTDGGEQERLAIGAADDDVRGGEDVGIGA